MFDQSEIIVGLEIGTAKVCAVVGEQDGEGNLNIVGLGTAPSAGAVRKGEIINTQLAEDALREALGSAEEDANIEIGSVYLGVTGAHITSFNHRGMHPIASVDREIDEEDVEKVALNAQPQLPPDPGPNPIPHPSPGPVDPNDPLGPPIPPISDPLPGDPADPPPLPNPDEQNPPVVAST